MDQPRGRNNKVFSVIMSLAGYGSGLIFLIFFDGLDCMFYAVRY